VGCLCKGKQLFPAGKPDGVSLGWGFSPREVWRRGEGENNRKKPLWHCANKRVPQFAIHLNFQLAACFPLPTIKCKRL